MTSSDKNNDIETLRVLATLLLVAYHAIGVPGSGLQLDYPHPFRLMSDFLSDLRMPLFAFISGYVYALRPVRRGTYFAFSIGKLRRLYIPGVVAALSYWCVARFVLRDAAGGDADLLSVLSLSFLHFWFLQAILIILLVMAAIDVASGRWARVIFVLCAIPMFFLESTLGAPYVNLSAVAYLAPFFVFGVMVQSHQASIRQHGKWIGAVALLGLVVAVCLSCSHYLENGVLPNARRDLQSILFSFSGIALLWLLLPPVPVLAGFGSMSFAVFLYHVFGTSGGRRLGHLVGLENEYLLFALSFSGGVIVPVVIYQLVVRTTVPRMLVLGLRGKPAIA
ncbi:MAG: acyltransferase [Pseudomonadota bacterium]